MARGNSPLPPAGGDESPRRSLAAYIGLVAGPLLALALWISPSLGGAIDGRPQLSAMAGVTVLMAVWWMTEAVPMAATALLPLALFPLLRIMPGGDVASAYAHPLVFLFLGGFLVALAIEETGLHRRLALLVVAAVGDSPRMIVAGFMAATAMLSMWLSNTATTLMMLPIAASVISQADHSNSEPRRMRNFGVALMLGIAYAASIGGIATPIGTPTNVAFREAYDVQFRSGGGGGMADFMLASIAPPADAPDIGFFQWMVIGLPFSLVFLGVAWVVLTWLVFSPGSRPLLGGRNIAAEELRKLGRTTADEWVAAAVFAVTAVLWVLREPLSGYGWAPILRSWLNLEQDERFFNDATPAILMAVLCFAIPSITRRGQALLSWRATRRLPWGILILFAGGLALADGMSKTGLDEYLGGRLADAMAPLPDLAQATVAAGGMTWLTELTSNIASVQMISPILGGASKKMGTPPLLLMIPAAMAASCAFMLPVATPPNAIVFGSGRVQIRDMLLAGLVLNLLSVVFIIAAIWLLGPLAFGEAATAR